MAALNGTWKLAKVENFEAYLDQIGVGAEGKAKGMKMLTPENNITQEINVSGDDVSIKTVTPVAPMEVKCTLGKQIDHKFMDGRDVKMVVTLSGDTLVEEISGPFSSRIERYLDGGDMIMKMTAGGVTHTRRYTKV